MNPRTVEGVEWVGAPWTGATGLVAKIEAAAILAKIETENNRGAKSVAYGPKKTSAPVTDAILPPGSGAEGSDSGVLGSEGTEPVLGDSGLPSKCYNNTRLQDVRNAKADTIEAVFIVADAKTPSKACLFGVGYAQGKVRGLRGWWIKVGIETGVQGARHTFQLSQR